MNNSFDPEDDPDWKAFVKDARERLVPKIDGTSLFISITPLTKEKVDIKFALELGLAIMYDKPIIAVIQPGFVIPKKMAAVVDRFVELDMNDPTSKDRLMGVISEMMEGFSEEGQ